MSKRSALFIFAIAIVASASALAAPISFTTAEGYVTGDLNGQPGTGQDWSCTTNNTNNIFDVGTADTGLYGHVGYLLVAMSNEHGVAPALATVDYAAKRFEGITGQFAASFSVCYNPSADDVGDESIIALGQSADSGWGVYLGLNKTNDNSMAYHNGAEWVEITTGLSSSKWFDVEIVGDVATGLYDLKIYQENLRSDTDPLAGLIANVSGLQFRDDPTALNYVMLTNEGSYKDTGGYYHGYDDLDIMATGATVPEPGTIAMILAGATGLVGVIRRKK